MFHKNLLFEHFKHFIPIISLIFIQVDPFALSLELLTLYFYKTFAN